MTLQPKPARASEVVMTHMILPPDANPLNAAFGGKVMEWIDVCGGIAAQRHCRKVVVTASMDDLHFHVTIKVGWIVTLRARVLAAFRTSMEVGVVVEAEDPLQGLRQVATTALLTFVALEADGTKAPVPPLELVSEQEKRAFQQAQARRDERLARKAHAREAWQHLFSGPSDERG
ncbi:MAG TPA: acyl-CoA thioesterase [Myxococcales bacterium]|jgi:acyl-CoA hydrolase|nr:acyl-CoA thioesterase [Myxococcales bacterium]